MAQGSLVLLLRHLRRTLGASNTSISDAELLERFLTRRDEAAFEVLVRRHERMVFGVCQRVLRHTQDAEDAFQATFLTLACNAGAVCKREALASWLYKVAFRIALRAKKHAAKRAQKEQPLLDSRSELYSPQPVSQTDDHDVRHVLDEEVHRLPSKYRAPVILCYLEGKTNEEAARQLGCPTGTVVTNLARARKRLRDRLVRRGLGVSTALLATALAPSWAAPVVPAALVETCLKVALLFVTDRAAAASVVSANVAFLIKGTLRAMLMTKLVATALVTFAVLGSASGVWAYRTAAVQAVEALPDQPRLLAAEQRAQSKGDDAKKPGPAKQAATQDKQYKTLKEVVTKSFKTGRSPHVVVDLFDGGIDVVADAESMVNVHVTKRGGGETEQAAQAALKNLEVEMAQEGDTVRVTARWLDKDKKTNSGASAEIRVPREALLELTTENGPISIVGGTGRWDLKTSNGGIKIRGEKSEVTARTSNGSIEFQGRLANGEHSFHTSNGSIVLALPADARFRFDAETSRGHITNEFSKDKPRDERSNHLVGMVGKSPSISIKLHTSNGNIALRPQEARE